MQRTINSEATLGQTLMEAPTRPADLQLVPFMRCSWLLLHLGAWGTLVAAIILDGKADGWDPQQALHEFEPYRFNASTADAVILTFVTSSISSGAAYCRAPLCGLVLSTAAAGTCIAKRVLLHDPTASSSTGGLRTLCALLCAVSCCCLSVASGLQAICEARRRRHAREVRANLLLSLHGDARDEANAAAAAAEDDDVDGRHALETLFPQRYRVHAAAGAAAATAGAGAAARHTAMESASPGGPLLGRGAGSSGQTGPGSSGGGSHSQKSRGATLGRLLGLGRPERGLIVVATVALMGSTVCTMTMPALVGMLLSAVTNPEQTHPHEVLRSTTLLLVGVFGVGAFFSFWRGYLFNLAGERVVARLRKALFRHLLSLEVAFFDESQVTRALGYFLPTLRLFSFHCLSPYVCRTFSHLACCLLLAACCLLLAPNSHHTLLLPARRVTLLHFLASWLPGFLDSSPPRLLASSTAHFSRLPCSRASSSTASLPTQPCCSRP